MAAGNLSYFIKSLQAKIKKENDKGNEVFFCLYKVRDNISQKLIDMEPVAGNFSRLINNMVRTESPDIIKVDLFNKERIWIDGSVCDLRPKISTPVPVQGFQGFGEAEINVMVERRFEEKRKEEETRELKEIVKELNEENADLREKVEELENENEELEQALESKKQIRYYAGMLGDILESIGIRKDKLKKPLVELMGLNEEQDNHDEDRKKKLASHEDQSGIVEENSQVIPDRNEQKRFEIISIISDYLGDVSNQLLGEIFTIFSAIESEHDLAAEIIEYLSKRKELNT